ncbi:MAG: hypothetical protein SGI72_01455 [Planctomycetota bacterium]|nr:hypothetical protein [Planctomycetota bacterium]
MQRLRALALVLLLPALNAACQGVRTLSDPTLVIETSGGSELGVSTDYGVVFLGRTARSGPAEITAWFGDGPNIEKTVNEPVGNGVYTAETEIRLPTVEMSFDDPRVGSELVVIGRTSEGPWSERITVAEDPRVLGLVTSIPERLRNAPDQVGAGVYLLDNPEGTRKKLVGLVSGRIVLSTGDGEREYLTIVGPTDLWRLVSHRREPKNQRRWVYREDIQ